MAHKFHRLSTESAFPHVDNIDVYKYDNDFDYSRYNYDQMDLLICSVPWDMGEAHIGNRTISGIGNVVYFGSKAQRDAWFDAIPDDECYRFTTKFKELHREHIIDVEIPYDMCAKHNYLKVHYNLFANDDSPVKFEGDDGLRDWFWFIREVEFIAPNTTRLHLLDDAFQTWIYNVNITGMVLERGHAPMFEMKAAEFLENPLENNTNLLTEDVSFGTISQVKSVDVLELNSGNMYACIATTANPTASWGTKADGTWNTPASAYYMNNGNPSVYVFATAASNLNTLLTNIETYAPQFKQTIQGVFFASNKLLTLAGNFTFCNVSCYGVDATRKKLDFVSLTKSDFGYDEKYADLAKLYTSPYAQIEVTDETGNVDVVKIEDTNGTLSVSAALSIAYPFITIDAHLNGVGGNVSKSVTYKNITSHTFAVEGRWYDTLRTWNVPTFAVILDAATEYDYSTHFDRAQRVVDYTTAYNDTSETATAGKADRDASADAAQENVAMLAAANKANADAIADTAVSNAAINTATNTDITTNSNAEGESLRYTNVWNNNALRDSHIDLTSQGATATTQAAEQNAAIAATGGAVTAATGAITSALSGDVAGAVSSVVNGAVSIGTTMASTAVGVALTQTQAQITCDGITADTVGTNNMVNANFSMQRDASAYTTNAQNSYITGSTANNAATQKANATRTQTAENTAASNTASTEKANALRDYNATMANAARDRTQAQSAISNDIAQAALRSPFIYGSFSDGKSSANKPIALLANVVTQSKGAIAAAGDEFLRYGYMLDRYWEFDGNWNVGKYFTYWKLRDFWVTNLNVPDMYMDKLRFFLFGGVTIWRNPQDIGKRTIYENFA